MVFTEPTFLFFLLPLLLVLSLILFFAGWMLGLPSKFLRIQNGLLLLFSILFYVYGENLYVVIMLFSIVGNYLTGLAIDRFRGRQGERYALLLGLTFNLTLLGYLKYGSFVAVNLNPVLAFLGIPVLQIGTTHLPIGISFFTFQAMSYIVDVHRRQADVQKSLAKLALYISLFPQLIAGPIVRYHDICQQLSSRLMTADLFASGVRRFVLGLGKKMVIANTMAIPVDAVFNQPMHELTFCSAWLASLCYALQIYFDFSGYSDMAIGLGRMFGFQFLENFNYPYISTSVTEFWRRWHISLSTWFRDYVYIPLGGNRRGNFTTYRNLLLVFFLCGLWHGASWTFVIWGLYHGMFLIVERAWLLKRLPHIWKSCRHAYLIVVVLLGWCIFRSETVDHLKGTLAAMSGLQGWVSQSSMRHFQLNDFRLTLAAGIVLSTPVMRYIHSIKEWSCKASYPIWIVLWNCAESISLLLILVYSAMLMAAGTYNPFIYFRF